MRQGRRGCSTRADVSACVQRFGEPENPRHPKREPSRKSPSLCDASAYHQGKSKRQHLGEKGASGEGNGQRGRKRGGFTQSALRRAASTARAPARWGAPECPTAVVTEDIAALTSGAMGSTLAWLPVLTRYTEGGRALTLTKGAGVSATVNARPIKYRGVVTVCKHTKRHGRSVPELKACVTGLSRTCCSVQRREGKRTAQWGQLALAKESPGRCHDTGQS